MVKTAHHRDENGTDIQEVIHCIDVPLGNHRYVYVKRHSKIQGRDIFFEDEKNKKNLRVEIFECNQALWDELAKAEIGATL